ncbi:MAG: tyrosine-type recombinase/integrase [Terracidiphilus sp.]
MHSLLRSALRAIGAPEGANSGFPGLKSVRPRETVAPDHEFEAVLRCAGPMLELAMLLAREAGLRHKAIRELRLVNCNFELGLLIGRTKSWSTYNVPMTRRLKAKLMWACQGVRDPAMPILQQFNRGQRPVCGTNLGNKLLDAKKAAGVTGGWGLHDLRRSGARALFSKTGDIKKVQRFLGHVNPQHSWWYLGLQATELDQADVEACSPEQEQVKGVA